MGLTKVLRIFSDFLFPKFCYGCGKSGSYICKKCAKYKIEVNWAQKCHVCGKTINLGLMHKECKDLSYLDGLIFFAPYNKLIEKIIFEGKYSYYYDVFSELGEKLGKYLKLYKLKKDSVLTFVPVHGAKYNLRGFNQSQILAKKIEAAVNLPVKNLLIKNKLTSSQAGSVKTNRQINLKNSFSVNPEFKIPETVYIVDDVYTTGSTLNECAKVLKESGAKEVVGIVFAKDG